jgi:hypothetical protein
VDNIPEPGPFVAVVTLMACLIVSRHAGAVFEHAGLGLGLTLLAEFAGFVTMMVVCATVWVIVNKLA